MPKLPTVQTLGSRPRLVAGGAVIPFRGDIAQTAEARAFGQEAQIISDTSRVVIDSGEILVKEDTEREARDLDVEYSNAIRLEQYGDGTDANPGYFNLPGEKAVKGREENIVRLEEIHQRITGKASSARVRRLVETPFASRKNSALDSSIQHFGRERIASLDASTAARIKSLQDDAAVAGLMGNSVKVAELANEASNEAELAAERHGLGVDAVREKGEAAATVIHIQEIQRLAAVDADLARKYFKSNKANIDGSQYANIEKTLKGGEVREWADRAADKIVGGPGTLSDMLAAAKKVAPTSIKRRELENRIRRMHQDKVSSEAAALDQTAQSTYSTMNGLTYEARQELIDGIGDAKEQAAVQSLSNDTEARRKLIEKVAEEDLYDNAVARAVGLKPLSKKERRALGPKASAAVDKVLTDAQLRDADSDYQRAGDGGETMNKYLEAVSDPNPEKFAKLSLKELKQEFEFGVSKDEFDKIIVPRWSNERIKLNLAVLVPHSSAARTRTQIITQSLQDHGFDKDKTAVSQFNRVVDEEVVALEATKPTKQKASAEEIQAIADRLMIEVEVPGSTWFNDPDKRLFEVEPGEVPFVDSLDDIPEPDRTKFIDSMTRANGGKRPDPPALLDAYNDYLKEISSGR